MLLSGLASGLEAQSFCYDRAELVRQLAERYGEHQVGEQIIDDGKVLEIFASKTTFTLVITTTDRVSCIYAAGRMDNVRVPQRRSENGG